jgi:hypothetical protein
VSIDRALVGSLQPYDLRFGVARTGRLALRPASASAAIRAFVRHCGDRTQSEEPAALVAVAAVKTATVGLVCMWIFVCQAYLAMCVDLYADVPRPPNPFAIRVLGASRASPGFVRCYSNGL